MTGDVSADRSDALAELVSELPDGVVLTKPGTIDTYRHEWTQASPGGMALAVVRATEAAQVQAAVRWAARHSVPVVPRGAGTSLSAGSVSVEGGIVISLERMTAIEVDPERRTAVVEPGALNVDVKRAAAEYSLAYPPDPSSYEICSIGGNIATNAGGLCCVKYGVTTDYVLGLDVVLADGSLVTLGGDCIKDVAGLPLLKLMVGSEGTLGIVTRATLRLVPALPAPSTLVATFASTGDAARAVIAMGAMVRPSMVELMDNGSINAVEDYRPMGLDRGAGALLLVRSDAPPGARAGEMAAIEAAVNGAGATEVVATDDPAEGEMFAEARRAHFPAIDELGRVLPEDVGVPVPKLPELLAAFEEIATRFDVAIPVVAHAGDGNTHPAIVFPPGDEAAWERAQGAFEAIMDAAIGLGGTITGEHGVGRAKRDALPRQLGPEVMELNRRVKAAFDPQGILNPGVILD